MNRGKLLKYMDLYVLFMHVFCDEFSTTNACVSMEVPTCGKCLRICLITFR